MPPPTFAPSDSPQWRFFFGATAISRFALDTPTRRGYFALCAQYTALIGYWLTPIRLLSPYRRLAIRALATAISRFALNTPTRRGYFALIARYFSPMPDFLDFKGL